MSRVAVGSLLIQASWLLQCGRRSAGARQGHAFERAVLARPPLSRLLVFAGRALVAPGAVLAGAGVAALALLGASLSSSLVQFALRLGTCLLILAAVAYASRRIDRVPRAVSAMAQETLLVYFVHLCLVYGSIWNSGLQQWAGAALGPGGTATAVVVLLAAMAVLGGCWHWVKQARPRAVPGAWPAAAAVLVVPLL
jgi:predicted transporter